MQSGDTRHASLTRAEGALVMFAKAPVPGQVKTRLCPPLTPDEAATLHGSFVLDTLERTKAAVGRFKLPLDRFLACAPSPDLVFFKVMEERHGIPLIAQTGEDIGARMHNATERLFGIGYRFVLLVGTDVPTLPLDYYQRAVDLLQANDLVLGPAFDGGYYLIGLKRPAPEVFAGIPWSTAQVLALTQQKAASLGLKTALLPSWQDCDTIEDLNLLIEAAGLDAKKPKKEQVFSSRTAGALQLIAKRLRSRA